MTESEAGVRDWCRTYLAEKLRRPASQIGEEAEFSSLGLDSAELLFMVSALEDRFGLELSSSTTMDHPSIAALAKFIVAELGAPR